MTSLPATGLAYLLSQVGHHSSATFARHLEAIGLTPQQVGILRLVIVADGHYTQQALCQRLDVLPSRLVVLLDQLEDQRLVERRPNSEDRRSNVLFITAEGRRRFADAAVVSGRLDDALASDLTDRQQGELIRLLGLVAASEGLLPGVHPTYRSENHE